MAERAFPRQRQRDPRAANGPDAPDAAPAPQGSGLVADNLVKQFRKRPALRDVSISLRRGEVVGLLGPNG
ncbi:MAG: LPS export ABC transporter ATP-binding protein, partial [Dongiaceae bacterium]